MREQNLWWTSFDMGQTRRFFLSQIQKFTPIENQTGMWKVLPKPSTIEMKDLSSLCFFRLKCLLPGRDTTRFKHHHPHVVALPSTHPSGYYKVHTQKTGKTLLHQFYHCRKTLTSPSHSSLISCIQTCLLKIKSFLISHILSFFTEKSRRPAFALRRRNWVKKREFW
jgi:hypothetical protein